MSEEEKKAIEKLKEGKKIGIYEVIRTFKKEGIENFVITRKKYIETILNLIEKQQKEIENLKELMAHKNGYTKQLEEDLFENASNYVISKDKIREKIEEYKKSKNFKEVDEYGEIIEGEIIYKDIVEALQELLKEE